VAFSVQKRLIRERFTVPSLGLGFVSVGWLVVGLAWVFNLTGDAGNLGGIVKDALGIVLEAHLFTTLP
jgi:hypothetical protein